MRKILLGTTNPAKADYFAHILEGYDVSFLTLGDLDIRKIPDEAGSSPLENAQAKAAWYGQFWDYVLAADSALYIRELPLDDPRQPGLTVRRRSDGHVMTDQEAIAHYADLAHALGGRMTCWYQEGYAVANHGRVTGFMDDGPINDVYRFYMVDKPYPSYTPGWPLDSLSIWPATGKYFTEDRERYLSAVDQVLARDYAGERLRFLVESLELERVEKAEP